MSYTKGPWEVREMKGDDWPENRISVGPNYDHIAYAVCISPRYADREQILIDAQLISAAPDLYEALKEARAQIIEMCDSFNIPRPQASIDRYDAALKKAEL